MVVDVTLARAMDLCVLSAGFVFKGRDREMERDIVRKCERKRK